MTNMNAILDKIGPSNFKIEKPGIYYDVDVDEYHKDPCPEPALTQSIAKVLLENSPLHAFTAHPRFTPPDLQEEEKYVKARVIGDCAHSYLIGRGKKILDAPFDNWRKKEAQEFKKQAIDDGMVPILSEHLSQALELVDRFKVQLAAAGLNDAFTGDGKGEVCLVAKEDDIWLRSLVDWMASPVMFYDAKSTAMSVAPHSIGHLAAKSGWDIQAAMQERIMDHLDPDNIGRRKFRFVAIEQNPPFAMTPVELPESFMMMGRKKLEVAIELWRQCTESGKWPGYPTTLVKPEYPQYMETSWLNREMGEFENVQPRMSSAAMRAQLAGSYEAVKGIRDAEENKKKSG